MWETIKSYLTVDNFSNLSSILGFLLTIYIVYTIRNVKNLYKFKARIPKLLKRLDDIKSDIANAFNDFDNSHEDIQILFGKVEVVLKSIKKKLHKTDRNEVKKCIDKIKKIDNVGEESYDEAFEVYVQLNKTLEVVEDLNEEYKWER